MILTVSAPEPTEWAEGRRNEHVEVESVGTVEGKGSGEGVVVCSTEYVG